MEQGRCSDVPVTTLTSRALVLDLLTIGQSCNETESGRQSEGCWIRKGEEHGGGAGMGRAVTVT